jgi:hypothetical protein
LPFLSALPAGCSKTEPTLCQVNIALNGVFFAAFALSRAVMEQRFPNLRGLRKYLIFEGEEICSVEAGRTF